MKNVVLLICLLISIYSYNKKNKKTDLDKMGLKGNIVIAMPEVWSLSN